MQHDKRTSGGAIIGGLVALVLLLLGAYIAGYFLLGEKRIRIFIDAEGIARQYPYPNGSEVRGYSTSLEARVFAMAANIESLLTGREVSTECWPND